MIRKLLFCTVTFISAACFAQPLHWSDMKPGQYSTGFRVIEEKDKQGRPFLISLWYPSVNNGVKMTLKDYVETGLINGQQDKVRLRQEFKHTLELPFLFNIGDLSPGDYEKVLTTPVSATSNPEMKKGKWPLIISDTEPVSLFVTNEWLAGNGFVVAVPTVQFSPPATDAELYKEPTDALEYALQYMMKQPFIDTANVSAVGFGGGTQAAFYLTMKTSIIKCLVNIEGGVFMPLSKTTLSKDYNPAKFNVPMLHVVRPEVIHDESQEQFNAVRAPKYRITTRVNAIRHHDFTVYGRVVNIVLKKRGNDASLASEVFTRLHELILEFLKHRLLDSSQFASTNFFTLELF